MSASGRIAGVLQWLAEVAPVVGDPNFDSLLPPWAQDLSLLGILVIVITAFLRGWVVTGKQNERDISAERRVSDIYENSATKQLELNQKITEALAPILDSNGAILKAVEAIQAEQERLRDVRRPR
jgi:hypothetical protein